MNSNCYNRVSDVLMRKKGVMLVPEIKDKSQDDLSRVVATMAHIMLSRGYLLSDELTTALLNSGMSANAMANYCQNVIKVVDDMYGNVVYKPFYKNFPREVMEADRATLVINAILHYISGGTIVPDTNEVEDLYAPISNLFDTAVRIDTKSIKIMGLGDINMFYDICTNLMNANTSISAYDKDD